VASPSQPTPLRALGWLGVFALLTVGAQFAYLYYLDHFYFPEPLPPAQRTQRLQDFTMSSFGLGMFYLLQVAVILPTLLYAASFPGQSWPRTLAINPVPWSTVGKWLVIWLAVMTTVNMVLVQFDAGEELFMEQFLNNPHWLMLVAASLLAPMLEELLFRGYLYKAFRPTRLGMSGTLLLTSACFSLMHAAQYSWYGVAQIFCLALVLGLARERSGSILTPIAIHTTQNTLASLLVLTQ
jgi:membrane protease YdiL (CAAX protease family)